MAKALVAEATGRAITRSFSVKSVIKNKNWDRAPFLTRNKISPILFLVSRQAKLGHAFRAERLGAHTMVV
jgi:hypothetical protein